MTRKELAHVRTTWIQIAVVSALAVCCGSMLLSLWRDVPRLGVDRSSASNVGFFLLINMNIVVVMFLVFLVTKNIVRLILDRRRNILGARLRTKLVTAFVGLSLVPTVLLFLVAKGILESVLQGWFSPQVAASVDGALHIARIQQDFARADLQRRGIELATELSSVTSVEMLSHRGAESVGAAKNFLDRWSSEQSTVDSVDVIDRNGEMILSVGLHGSRDGFTPDRSAFESAMRNVPQVRAEQTRGGNESLRAYIPVLRTGAGALAGLDPPVVLVLTVIIPPEMSRSIESVVSSYEDYRELRSYRRPLASTYLLTLVVVTLLIVFAAIWVGFHLARSLSIPIGLLGKATAEVAQGNLDCRIPDVGDDELSVLVRSFNTMTADLKTTTDELVARRRYMEIVFAHLTVGIISFDGSQRIRAMNRAACVILGRSPDEPVERLQLGSVLPRELHDPLEELLSNLSADTPRALEGTVSVRIGEETKYLQLTATRLTVGGDAVLGTVLLVDDITEIVSAQRMAAWRDVARRIAHEIKNPLTPIQLCAQRIQRRFSAAREGTDLPRLNAPDRALIDESTGMIVEQVETLRELVNEFSQFARMPRAKPAVGDLNALVRETVGIFRQAHPHIGFQLRLDDTLPEFLFDREQVGRVLVNVLDNAIAAVSESQVQRGGEGSITVETHVLAELGIASCAISDNGIGIPERNKQRLFEPYFSTKHGGTGLGLAIAQAIIHDHNGVIRAKDNPPHGATFIFEIPLDQAPWIGQRSARSVDARRNAA